MRSTRAIVTCTESDEHSGDCWRIRAAADGTTTALMAEVGVPIRSPEGAAAFANVLDYAIVVGQEEGGLGQRIRLAPASCIYSG